MASSLEGNKIIAAVLLAGVMATGSAFLGGLLYGPHEEPEKDAYPIATDEGGSEGGGEAAGGGEDAQPLPVLLAAADPGQGQNIAKKCASCHNFEQGGANKVGPDLYGVLGRKIASHEGFAYSEALSSKAPAAWDYDSINGFLTSPKDWAPGTKMTFAGLKKPEDRADVIMYLKSISPEAPPVPVPDAAGGTGVATQETPGSDAAPESPKAGGEPYSDVSQESPTDGRSAPEKKDGPVGPDVPVPSEAEAKAETTPAEVEKTVGAGERPAQSDVQGDNARARGTAGRLGNEAASLGDAAPKAGEATDAPTAEGAVAPGEKVVPMPAAESASGETPALKAPEGAPQGDVDTASNEASLMGGKQGTTTGDATTGEAQEAGQGAGKPQTGASVQTGNVTGQGPNVGGDEAKPGEAAAKEQRVAQAEPAAAQAGGGGAAAAPAGDPEAGKKVFNKCKACHAADKNKVGPHLGGVVGRPVASVADYTYSNAMKDHGGEWTPDRLDAYLADPRGVVKGTKMVFAGLKKEEDRANVIAYLTTLKAE